MELFMNRETPDMRIARLGLELACVEIQLEVERRRARRELDAPMAAPRIPRRVTPHERHRFN